MRTKMGVFLNLVIGYVFLFVFYGPIWQTTDCVYMVLYMVTFSLHSNITQISKQTNFLKQKILNKVVFFFWNKEISGQIY